MMRERYIHGTSREEQLRLKRINWLTNPEFLYFVKLDPTDKVLELGCGTGILAAEMAKKVPEGSLTGIDLFEEQLLLCPCGIDNLEFILGDIMDLPFPASTFHVVYGRFILEHVINPHAALREAKRVLKPGGRLYLQENSNLWFDFYPECPAFRKAWEKFVRIQEEMGGDAMIGKKLYALLKENGFRQIGLSFANEIHYPEKESFRPWIDNLIDNLRGAEERLAAGGLTRGEMEAAITEMEEFKNNPLASTYFSWNRARCIR